MFGKFIGKVQSGKQSQDAPVAAIVAPVVIMGTILIGVGIFFWRWMHKKREEERELIARIQIVSS